MNAAYLTPAITLFNEDGTLDLASQERLFNNLIDQGVDGILVEGSSSEFFAMPMNQRREMAKFAIEKIDHRVKLIIGTSHMVADEIISFSNFCLDAGADAVMILPPYYFHFGPSALLQYYDRLAEQIHGDIYIYNFPDNTGYTIPPETVLALAKMHPNIVGMKDTVPGMDHTRELIKVVKSQIPQFEIYSGFDDNFAHNVLSGGNGCIGALSNVVPEICAAWVRAFRENDLAGIARGQQTIDRLMAGELDAQLVYRKRLRRPLSEYQRNVPPHVRAARLADEQNIKRGRAPQYQNRGTIKYVWTVNGPEPVDYQQSALDYEHYLTRQIQPVAEGILPFIDDNFATLLTGQLGLF